MKKVTSSILRQKSANFFFFVLMVLYIHLWLCRVFVAARGPSPGAVSGGRPTVGVLAAIAWRLPVGGMGSGLEGSAVTAPRLWSPGSAVTAHRPSCSKAREISQTRDRTSISCFGRRTLYHGANFSIKGQIVNTVGFVDHTASVTVTHLCCGGMKAIVSNTLSDARNCVTIKLYLQK